VPQLVNGGPRIAMNPQPYLIVTGDFVATGGMDRANLALASYLAESPALASHVHLVCHRADDELARHPRVTLHQVPRPLGSHWLAGPMLDRAGRRVARSLPGVRVVVNGGNCRTPRASANWVHYLHACWTPDSGPNVRLPWQRRIKHALAHRQFLREERIALELAPRIIANSHLTAQHIARYYPQVADRVRVVYYGTDAERFGPVTSDERSAARESLGLGHDRPVVVFVGALGDARKGFDILFDAWTNLAKSEGWDARLLVVGAGASLPLHESIAARAGLGDSLRFLGFRRDVPTILAAADLLVSPVRYEAYGLNVHEALCREIPVLVSAESGVAERLPAGSPVSPSALMRLRGPVDPGSLAEALGHWRERIAEYREAAKVAGAVLRADSWASRMGEFAAQLPAVAHDRDAWNSEQLATGAT